MVGYYIPIIISILILIVIVYISYTTVPPNIQDTKPDELDLVDVSNLKYCKVYNVTNYIYNRDLDILMAPYPNKPVDICRGNRDYEGCISRVSPTSKYPTSRPIAIHGNRLYYGYLTGNPGCQY